MGWQCRKCGYEQSAYWVPVCEKCGSPKILSSCFVATLVYGTDSEEVTLLRNWRDKDLIISPVGRNFVKFYYYVSPHLIPFMSKSKSSQKFARFIIDFIINKIK